MGFLRRILGEKDSETPAPGQPAVRREITPNELAEKLAQPEPPFILDVREPSEYMDAHITRGNVDPAGATDGARQ